MPGRHEQIDPPATPAAGHGGEPGEPPRDVARAEHDHPSWIRAGQFHRRHGVSPMERLWKHEAASMANMMPRNGSPRV